MESHSAPHGYHYRRPRPGNRRAAPAGSAGPGAELFQYPEGAHRNSSRWCDTASDGLLRRRRLTFPIEERHKVYRNARIYILIYAAVITWAIAIRSILPLMYIGLPAFYGAWLMVIFGLTQHAGLAEDVLDHRLNCRTVYMNPIFRYLYWEMNYHVEHHMFPMVPYHALGKLHQELKADMPKPYNGLWEAYREIIPTILRQVKDPTYFVRRQLPGTAQPVSSLEPA